MRSACFFLQNSLQFKKHREKLIVFYKKMEKLQKSTINTIKIAKCTNFKSKFSTKLKHNQG